MKHILENKTIEQEYMLFQLSPKQYYSRIVDLCNIWSMGYENQFKKLFEQPSEDYLQDYAESEDEWFALYLQKEGAENHPNYGEIFDMRSYKDMKLMRTILENTK